MTNLATKLIAAMRFLYYYPIIFIHYITYRLLHINPKPFNQLKTIGTDQISELISNGKSLIRFGDGEVMILLGSGIHFQKFNPRLQQKIKNVVRDYKTNSSYILALPNFALTESNESLGKRGRLRIWRLFKIVFKHLFPKDIGYADAMIFYHKETFEKFVVPSLLNKYALVLSNSDNNTPELKAQLNKLNIEYEYVTTKKINAFDDYDTILKLINDKKSFHNNLIVLTSMGPGGKALAYDLTKSGIQCIDIGHGIEIIGKTKDYSEKI